ncbi:putative coat protein [Leptopilina boulardi Toti-like virus]|uniref:Putative coat protein n=1 Tax=Leptopilina boulardi Toti-like virus TaxID=1353795 RepID=A0A088BEI5_9VIRU|nr:putative coat protein [Leptopilina boulardi Toti-like virus]AGW80478.2 putative coat protein [Leptopilina boulardi Toti-like virus]
MRKSRYDCYNDPRIPQGLTWSDDPKERALEYSMALGAAMGGPNWFESDDDDPISWEELAAEECVPPRLFKKWMKSRQKAGLECGGSGTTRRRFREGRTSRGEPVATSCSVDGSDDYAADNPVASTSRHPTAAADRRTDGPDSGAVSTPTEEENFPRFSELEMPDEPACNLLAALPCRGGGRPDDLAAPVPMESEEEYQPTSVLNTSKGDDGTEPYLTGDVGACVNVMWGLGVNQDGPDQRSAAERGFSWATMCAVSADGSGFVNTREVGVFERPVEAMFRSQDTDPSQRTRYVVKQGTSRAANPEVKKAGGKRVRKVAIGTRARAIAEKIHSNGPRVLGALEGGGKNPQWAAAVARAIVKIGMGSGTMRKWEDTFAGTLLTGKDEGRHMAERLKELVLLWAADRQGLLEEDDGSEGEGGAGPPSARGREGDAYKSDELASIAFGRCLSYGRMAAAILSRRVCPFCLFCSVASVDVDELEVAEHRPSSRDKSDKVMYDRLARGPTPHDTGGWLEAAARAHNKEQHALNGNIDAVTGNSPVRDGKVASCKVGYWDSATEMVRETDPWGDRLDRSMAAFPRLYYMDGESRIGWQGFCNYGTLHQSLYDEAEEQMAVEQEEARVCARRERSERRAARRAQRAARRDRAEGLSTLGVTPSTDTGGPLTPGDSSTPMSLGVTPGVGGGSGRFHCGGAVGRSTKGRGSILTARTMSLRSATRLREALGHGKSTPERCKTVMPGVNLDPVVSVPRVELTEAGGAIRKGTAYPDPHVDAAPPPDTLLDSMVCGGGVGEFSTPQGIPPPPVTVVDDQPSDAGSGEGESDSSDDDDSDAGGSPGRGPVGDGFDDTLEACSPGRPRMSKHDVNIHGFAGRTRWLGVGVSSAYHHGRLESTGIAEKLSDAGAGGGDVADVSRELNPGRAYWIWGQLCCTPQLAAGVLSAIKSERVDWRVLGYKITLYDMLREEVLTMPTGVDWAWAQKAAPTTTYTLLSDMGQWHYDAIVVECSVIELALRGQGEILVGEGVTQQAWSLRDERTAVVGWADNEAADDLGRYAWLVSHLTYPLAWVMDRVNVYTLGRVPRSETFIRTAGLVDVHSRVDRIIIVVPSKTKTHIRVGNATLAVAQTDRHGERIVPRVIHPVDLTQAVGEVVAYILNSKRGLRAAFTAYANPYFKGGFNWIEVESIINVLTVRFHQRVEAEYDIAAKKKLAYGAPADVLKMMGLDAAPSVTTDSFADYGGANAVSPVDHRCVRRIMARTYPAVSIGSWSNMAEVALCTGWACYNTFNAEKVELIAMRMFSSNTDRITRTRYLRVGYEEWKLAAALTDQVGFPLMDEPTRRQWPEMVDGGGKRSGGTNVEWFALGFITDKVKWAWSANVQVPKAGLTLTGLRTPSSAHRDILNTEWADFKMVGAGRTAACQYDKDDITNSSTVGRWRQFGHGEDDPQLWYALMRLNLEKVRWDLGYMTHPGNAAQANAKYAWLVDSLRMNSVALDAGWLCPGVAPQESIQWGWGVRVLEKVLVSDTLRSLTINCLSATLLTGSDFTVGTCLFRGSYDEPVVGVFRQYAGAARGLNPDLFDGGGKGKGGPAAPAEGHLKRILDLERQIEELRMASTAMEKALRNAQDPAEPPAAASDVAGGGKRLGVTNEGILAAAGNAGPVSRMISSNVVHAPPVLEEQQGGEKIRNTDESRKG